MSYIRVSLPDTSTETFAPLTLRPFPSKGKVGLADNKLFVGAQGNIYARNGKSVLVHYFSNIKRQVGKRQGYAVVPSSRSLNCHLTDLPSEVVQDLVKLGALTELPVGLTDAMTWRDKFQDHYNGLASDANNLFRENVLSEEERNTAEAKIIHAATVAASCGIGHGLTLDDLTVFKLNVKFDNKAARYAELGIKKMGRKAPAKKPLKA